MKNNYNSILLQLTAMLLLALSSCKKDSTPVPAPAIVKDATPVTIGLFEYGNSTDNRIFIPISKIGTKTVNYDEIFDSGSTGLTIDAKDIVPDNMKPVRVLILQGIQ